MKKTKMRKIQKLRMARIQKIAFIGMAIFMGFVQYVGTNCHDCKFTVGRVTVSIRL